MPWLVGIDEAGYGPNLGPLVMSSVACRVPAGHEEICLWQTLRTAVRRSGWRTNERVLIEDSKLVYSTARGLAELERGVLAMLFSDALVAGLCLGRYVGQVCPDAAADLHAEPWYTGTSPLPLEADPEDCQRAAGQVKAASSRKGVLWGPARSVVVCPGRFNALLDRWGSKGAALGQALASLLQANRGLPGDEPITFVIDKHGGRNCYAAMLQDALPDGVVVAHEEGQGRSLYGVLGLGREVRILITPRADGTHLCVALASMASKYLREVLMREFNLFWQGHIPGLRPTAGYPGDADRFFQEIRPALERLAIADNAVWRRK